MLRPVLLPLTAAVILALGATFVTAGKPPQNPPTAPLPPVRYQIQFFDVPNPDGNSVLNDMNNQGQCVGWYIDAGEVKRAFLYDPLVDPSMAVDLNTIVTAPQGWVIASAVGINGHGVIVGYLEPEGSTGAVRSGFLLDPAQPVLTLLPDSTWDYTFPRRINENGDVLGVYYNHNPDETWGTYLFNSSTDTEVTVLGDVRNTNVALNNPTDSHDVQVAGTLPDNSAFRWTRGQGLEVLPLISPDVSGINDAGTVSGSTSVKLKGNRSERRAMRYSSSLELLPSPYVNASAINSSSDVSLGTAFYRDDWGALPIDELIDTSDPDAALWFSNSRTSVGLLKLTERLPETGFCGFAASVLYNDALPGRLCLLSPVPTP